MKKDIEWLKEEIGDLPIADTVFISDGVSYIDSAVSVMSVYDLIDQLDEPEVLSQEWIDKHKYRYDNIEVVGTKDLQNPLVPKQEMTFDEVHDKLREESILSEKSFDYYWNCINDNVEMDEPGNLIIPKQELPVIPKYVADFLEKFNVIYDSCVRYLVEAHNGDLYYLNDMMVEDGNLTLDEANELCEWAEKQKQSDLLKLINGYTVKEEQKYYAMVKGHELLDDVAKYWAHNKYDLEDLFISYETRDDSPIVVKNTKKHWNDLGINDSNADFVRVEEME